MPSDVAAGDASFKGATRVAANEAITDAELVEGLERPETETTLFLGLHADILPQAEISQRPAALHHLEFVSQWTWFKKKNKNLEQFTVGTAPRKPRQPGVWLLLHPPVPAADLRTGF